jgi:hypothetical protein
MININAENGAVMHYSGESSNFIKKALYISNAFSFVTFGVVSYVSNFFIKLLDSPE